MGDGTQRSWLDVVLKHSGAQEELPDGVAALRGRVVLYVGVQGFFLLVFFTLRTAMMWHADIFATATPPMMWSWAGMGVSALLLANVAMQLRRRAISELRARLAESLTTVFMGLTVPFSAAGAPAGLRPELLASFALTLMLMSRAALVPSTATRSMVVGALAALPTVTYAGYLAYWTPPPPDLPNVAIRLLLPAVWSVTCVTLTTLASHTIYRLHVQVDEAKHVGQYRLVRKLGAGGMGEVYLARHALLRRPTAVKLLTAARAGKSNVARFEREVQEASQLTHPNTVSIFDFGHTPNGTFYYAMEYLDGLSLEQLVEEEGPQPAGRVANILRQAALALAEAHERGLVHRDVKPANIMLCDRGGVADMVKVVDFGLVKQLDDGAEAGLTKAEAVVGTPHYLAPETIASPDEAGAGVDIYALGAVGYFLLTGSTVFEGATIAAICAEHIHGRPKPVEERCAGPVSPELAALVMSSLAKDPAERPQSARQLARDLAACPDRWSEEEARERWVQREARRSAPPEIEPSIEAGLLTVDFRARR